MLPVIWNEAARADLTEIITYIAADNPPAAQRLKNAIEMTGEAIGLNPMIYRSGRSLSTRECVVTPNYMLVFTIERETVRIVRVLHVSRQYP